MSSGLGGEGEGLGGLGSLGGGASLEPSLGADPDPPSGSRPVTASRGPREGLILLVFAVLSVLAVAATVVREERRALHDPVQKAARGEIGPLGEESFVRAARLSAALATIERQVPGTILTNLRLEPTRVDAIVRNGDGDRQSVQVGPALALSRSSFGAGLDRGVRFDQVDTRVPERFLASVRQRTGAPAGDLDYLVLSVSSVETGAGSWILYLRHGRVDHRGWIADAHGRDVRLIGQLPAAQRAAQARLLRRQKRRLACLKRARTAADVGRCPSP